MSSNNMDKHFKKKYLKYKYKYFQLLQKGGQVKRDKIENFHVFQNKDDTQKIIIIDNTKRRQPTVLIINKDNSDAEKKTNFLLKDIFELSKKDFSIQFKYDKVKYKLVVKNGKITNENYIKKFTIKKKGIDDLENVLLEELSEYQENAKPKDAITPDSDLLKPKDVSVAITPDSDLSKIKKLDDLKISDEIKLVNFIDIDLNKILENEKSVDLTDLRNLKYLVEKIISYSINEDILPELLESVKNIFAKELKIDKDNFILSKSKLGKGSYGTVYKIKSKDNNFAMKFSEVPEQEFKNLEEEINYTKILSDNKITPKYYGSVNYKNESYGINYSFLLSDAYDINLNDYFLSYIPWYLANKDKFISVKNSYNNIEEIINNKLLELSNLLIYCVDLKPQNIVVKIDADNQITDLKLIDWGGDFCKNKNNLSEEDFPDRELLKKVIYDMMVVLMHLWFKYFTKLEFKNNVISEINSKLDKDSIYREYFGKLFNFQKTLLILKAYYIDTKIFSSFKDLLRNIFGQDNLEKLLIELNKLS